MREEDEELECEDPKLFLCSFVFCKTLLYDKVQSQHSNFPSTFKENICIEDTCKLAQVSPASKLNLHLYFTSPVQHSVSFMKLQNINVICRIFKIKTCDTLEIILQEDYKIG